MSDGPSTPFSGPNMANGSSPDDQLRLEAARKRLKIERDTSESESPLDAQIRRMTKELEELKKQRQVAELQEQIWTEQQLLEASRNRLSVAAASASPTSSSPAPIQSPALTPASTAFTPTSTALVPSTVSTPVPVAPKQQQQQQQQLKAQQQKEQQLKQQQLKEQLQKDQQRKQQEKLQQERQQKALQQQQQKAQQQRPWFERPCTPGAPADSTINQLPPYQGLAREEYANFISALEAHFAKAPQYYTKDREYRKVKLGLQHLGSAPRDSWHALAELPDTWQNFRIFLFKVVVRNLKPTDQVRLANTSQPSTPTAQTPAAMQPPPAQSSMPKVPLSPPAQQAQKSPQAHRNGSPSHGPPSVTPNHIANAAVAKFVNQQNLRETVQTFSGRLQQTSSFNAELSLHDRMGVLKKGVVPSIRNRAHRPSSYFKTYDEYVVYLQDIEDTLPQRQAELKGEQPPQMTGSSWVPVAWNENSNQQTAQQPLSVPRGRSPAGAVRAQSNVSPQAPKSVASPLVRSQASPGSLPRRPENGPTSPAAPKSAPRRMPSPVPPEPKVKPTDGRDWWACRNYIGQMEAHFRDHPRYFTTEERKVAVGRRYLCSSLRGKWNAFASKTPQMTWFDLCVFIINQSAQSFAPEDAATRYIRSSQKAHQRVRDFALWVQQYAPHYQRHGWNELRHLYDRILPTIRRRARKDWNDFKTLAPFVAYLEAVESTHPDIRRDCSDNTLPTVPRKRSREE